MGDQTVSSARSHFKARQIHSPSIGDVVIGQTGRRSREIRKVVFRIVDKHKNYPVRGGSHSCRPIVALFRTRDWPTREAIDGSFWLEWEYACLECGELRRRVAREGRRPGRRGLVCADCGGDVRGMADFPEADAAAIEEQRTRRVSRGPSRYVLWEAASEGELGVEWNTCE